MIDDNFMTWKTHIELVENRIQRVFEFFLKQVVFLILNPCEEYILH